MKQPEIAEASDIYKLNSCSSISIFENVNETITMLDFDKNHWITIDPRDVEWICDALNVIRADCES